MALSKLGNRRQVVIPQVICDQIGLKAGDFLEIVRSDNNQILLKPKKIVDWEDTLTPAEEEMVARGLRDLEEGRVLSLSELTNELGL